MPDDSAPHADDLEAFARQRFHKLNAAEEKLLRAAPVGEIAVCGVADAPDKQNDPATAPAWGPEREIHAEIISWLCADPGASQRVDSRGVIVADAKIIGKLDLSFATIRFPLRFWRCCLVTDADLNHATIPLLDLSGSSIRGLNLEGATVSGNVFLRRDSIGPGLLTCGFSAVGEVKLLGAQIGGNLDCDGGSFLNFGERATKKAIFADGVKVSGYVFLRGTSAMGEVNLLHAQIGSNLECDGASFENPGGFALLAQHADVKGDICLRKQSLDKGEPKNFSARGEVNLFNARIRGNLDCHGGKFDNGDGEAIIGEIIQVDGHIHLHDHFIARGSVRLFGAQIGQSLNCSEGSFNILTLETASIKGIFDWSKVQNSHNVQLNLKSASVGTLEDDEASWPSKGNLDLDGFTYNRISAGPSDPETRLQWLERQDKFTRQPYQQLAKVLHDGGDEPGGRRVLFEMEDRSRREQHGRSWSWRTWDWVYKRTVGYGYNSEQALLWLAALTLVGSLFFGLGYLGGAIAPNDKEAYGTFEQQGSPPNYYVHFNPLVYSFEHSFPLINLSVKDHWEPTSALRVPVVANGVFRWMQDHHFRLRFPSLLRGWMWLQTLAGWILATLYVAGLTGIVKSD